MDWRNDKPPCGASQREQGSHVPKYVDDIRTGCHRLGGVHDFCIDAGFAKRSRRLADLGHMPTNEVEGLREGHDEHPDQRRTSS